MAGNTRTEAYPSLAAKKNWAKYAAGVAVEAGFILFLTVVGFALAVIAKVIWP